MYEQKDSKQSNQIITLSMCESESRRGGACGIHLQKELIEFFHDFFFPRRTPLGIERELDPVRRIGTKTLT